MFGLAKRLEEIWLPDADAPILLDRHSPALYLIQSVRDEAHRFAITFHRQLRSKQTIRSRLEEIPGVGPKRRTAPTKKRRPEPGAEHTAQNGGTAGCTKKRSRCANAAAAAR